MNIKNIGFLGLGLMGSRMANNLLRKGFSLTVWNRTQQKAASLLDAGAAWANSPAELAASVDAFCTCVATPQALEEVAYGKDGLFRTAKPGQLFVDFSTVSPELSKRLASSCAALGVDYVEAPVTGSKGGAEAGSLVMMVGASGTAFDRAQPIFGAVGEKALHMGDVGAASHVKLAGNALIASMLQGLSEAMLFVAKAGVDPRKFLEVVGASGYRSPYFEFKGQAMLRRDFSQNFSVDLMFKDLSLFLEEAARLRMPTPATATVKEAYAMTRAQGRGDLDICGTVTTLEDLCGLKLK